MKKKILWIIIGIAIILLLIIAAFIVKQVNGSGKKDSEGYDTYTVKKETPISLEAVSYTHLTLPTICSV